ncbi:MAG TPA: SGNH/GDSL hydrolase family protein [Edaphobacter sp.]|jgi:phospholipase/lecithinase/hemolysin|nr:SGNH/GDSL hydrolase family protein [Edaphobacter sp.]
MRRPLVLLLVLCFCGFVKAQSSIERVYVFGDSYSDIGRGWVDTNGPTAVAYMAQDMGLAMVPSNTPDAEEKSLNFAVSGAPTGENPGHRILKACFGLGMKNQVKNFTASVQDGTLSFDPQSTVFFLAGGLNDSKIPTEETIANLEGEIQMLYAAGARRFRVAVLPEKIPGFSEVAQRLNPAIRNIPAAMEPKLNGAGVKLSQWGAFFDEVMTNPGKYGITDTTHACSGRSIFGEDATPCDSPATHYYFYKDHPSTAVHKAVGEMLYAELTGKKPASAMATVKLAAPSAAAANKPAASTGGVTKPSVSPTSAAVKPTASSTSAVPATVTDGKVKTVR